MFDFLSIVFWSLTYILVVIFSVKNISLKRRAIPLIPPILNIAWESNALLLSNGFWGHIAWFVLDVFILVIGIYFLPSAKRKYYIPMVVIVFFIFNWIIFSVPLGMLLSSFAIDLIMAICFWIDRKNILPNGSILIAIFKLLGDLSAAIFYSPMSTAVFVMAVIVLIFNSAYLLYRIKEKLVVLKEEGCAS